MGTILTYLSRVKQNITRAIFDVLDGVEEYYHYVRGTVPEGFEEQDVLDYLALTTLTKRQVFRAYRQFLKAGPIYIDSRINPYVRKESAALLPVFCGNPFTDRMLEVFSSHEDYMTFEDFLTMLSVLAPETSMEVKAHYAFMLYDFDSDDKLGIADLEEIIRRLNWGKELTEGEVDAVINQAMCEGDIDGDKFITYTEFHHALLRMPDFMSTFVINA